MALGMWSTSRSLQPWSIHGDAGSGTIVAEAMDAAALLAAEGALLGEFGESRAAFTVAVRRHPRARQEHGPFRHAPSKVGTGSADHLRRAVPSGDGKQLLRRFLAPTADHQV